MRAVLAVAAALLVAAAPAAGADDDLDRIPDALLAPAATAEPPAPGHGRYYVEEVPSAAGLRSDLAVPFPSPAVDWQNRLSLDLLDQWRLGDHLTASISDRANLLGESDFAFLSRQSLRNDLRELHLTWEPVDETWLDAGRINLRNGVALGFNPTDFFKARSAIGSASLDPSVLRENRLGTLMVRGETLWSGGSLSLAMAPKVAPARPLGDTTRAGYDPRLDRTNATDRMLLALHLDIADLAPQLLLFRQGGATRFGLNLSRTVGQSVVAYAEWAGGRQPTLIAEALRFGARTGTLPAGFSSPIPTDASSRFRSDASIGASWTGADKVTVNLEYHYHQAGFSGADWRNWFSRGEAARALDGPLWFIRGYAADQQQPVTRHELFVRADWVDAVVPDLELTGLAFVNLYDGSSLAQLSASYFLSREWTIGAYVAANLGGRTSERGSAPQALTGTLRLVRYF